MTAFLGIFLFFLPIWLLMIILGSSSRPTENELKRRRERRRWLMGERDNFK